MKVRVHKIASVVHRLGLPQQVPISRLVDARVGQALVVRALGEKSVYDQLELENGRMAHIGKGDVLVGALGRRDALRGFVGRVPDSLKAGDTLHVLNMGGVLGRVTSGSREVGPPLEVEVLGMALRDGKPANIADAAVTDAPDDQALPPVIVVSGSCMNAGKTFAACELIARLTARGYACGGVKLTGVAALRDTLNMSDHGAAATLSFVDLGLPSTAGHPEVASVARRVLASVAHQAAAEGQELDVIVAELGDGLIGNYGVDAILEDPGFRGHVRAHVLAATDLVAAWGGLRWMEQHGLSADVVCGPATDNEIGVDTLTRDMGVAAHNARLDAEALVDHVEQVAFQGVRS